MFELPAVPIISKGHGALAGGGSGGGSSSGSARMD